MAKRRRRRSGTPNAAPARPKGADSSASKEGKHRWVAIINSALAVAVAVALLSFFLPRIFSSPSTPNPGPSPHIEVDDLQVKDNVDGAVVVTVLLRNTGNQVAIIKSAQFYVEQAAVLPHCQSQGALSSSGTYPVTLPPSPRAGTTLTAVPVTQQEPGNNADAFSFHFGLPPGMLEGISVYELRITLSYDAARTAVFAGNVLLSLPSNPDGSYIWTQADEETHLAGEGTASEIAQWNKCMVHNSDAIKPMLKSSAYRSPGMTALTGTVAYCCLLADPAGSENS
jgi:hypothetical protein